MPGIPDPLAQFFPMSRGNAVHGFMGSIGVARLPTDSIGNFTLTLTNLVIGSAIRIELLGDGSLIEYRVADAASEVFVVPAYGRGNPGNSLRIKVRKSSSAPFYKNYETQATALVGSQSIFVSQIPD